MGQFLPGQLKPHGSGRKRGTRNIKSQYLIDALDAVNLNVPERISELLPQLPLEKQADILIGLMGFIYPKRKAVEFSKPDEPIKEVEDPNVKKARLDEKLRMLKSMLASETIDR